MTCPAKFPPTRSSCALRPETEMASAISTSSKASAGGLRASRRLSMASRKAAACRTSGDGSCSKARTSERPPRKTVMESLPGGLSALGRIPPSAADKSRLWVGHALWADITGRGRSEGPVFKSDQGPAGLLHYATGSRISHPIGHRGHKWSGRPENPAAGIEIAVTHVGQRHPPTRLLVVVPPVRVRVPQGHGHGHHRHPPSSLLTTKRRISSQVGS